MNKITKAVIDLSGEWPSTVGHKHTLYVNEIGTYIASDHRCIHPAVCTREEFEEKRNQLREAWKDDPSSAEMTLSEWLKSYAENTEQEWPADNRIDAIGQNGPTGEHYTSPNKYHRQLKGVTVDVYDVLQAFEVTNPALQHLIKKALCCGLRGHKDHSQDLQDIIDSAVRAKELGDA